MVQTLKVRLIRPTVRKKPGGVCTFFITPYLRSGSRRNMRNNNVKRMTLFALFLAIELILFFTPLGFIRIGFLSITLMHIPVIAASILLGIKEGMMLGLVFGLCSVFNATMAPSITSFVFSPFVTIGGISGNWASLVVALVPRVLLGWIPGALYGIFTKKDMNRSMAAALAAGIATACHTLLVLGFIILFFAAPYASAIGSSVALLYGIMGTTILTNGVPELLCAAFCMAALVKAVRVPAVQTA